MLESAEVGHRISSREYEREGKLRALLAQWNLSKSGKGPVLLIISGVEAGVAADRQQACPCGWTRDTSASWRSAPAPATSSCVRRRGDTGARCRRGAGSASS